MTTYSSKATARRAALKQQLNPALFIINPTEDGKFEIVTLDAAPASELPTVTTETQVPVEGWNQVEGGTVQDNAKPKKGKAKADKVDKPAPVAAKGRATASKDAPVDVTALRARLDALKIEIATVRASLKAAGKGNGGTRERVSTIENPVAFIWSSLNSMAKKNKGEVARKDALATLLAAGCGKNTISTQLHRWKHATPAERTARASKA